MSLVALALALALLIGLTLGLFGGGGSILTVPILVYVAGLDAKAAIATSLLVVGITSAAALLPHARAGNVRWRIGAVFGLAGMVGAFAGGQLARYLAGDVLLLLFAAMMLATAAAMWWRRPAHEPPQRTAPARPMVQIVVTGLAVGFASGLVGAGGGFLIVPALVLLGGLPMAAAVGTSLLVIAMNCGAGFLAFAAHAAVDYDLALGFSAAAVGGSLVGARLVSVLRPDRLRRAFAVFVVAMAAFVVYRERGILVDTQATLILHDLTPYHWAVAGALLGAITLLLLWVTSQRLGISTGFENLCALVIRVPYLQREEITSSHSWRIPFLGGLVVGGFLSAATSGGWSPFWYLGRFDAAFGWGPAGKLAWMFVGGLLIGFGTRLAGGCTSGHGIFGVSNLERASIESTLAFMAAGIVTTHVVYRLGGL